MLLLCTIISVNSWTFDVSFRSTIRIGEYFRPFLLTFVLNVVFITLSFTVTIIKLKYSNTVDELRRLRDYSLKEVVDDSRLLCYINLLTYQLTYLRNTVLTFLSTFQQSL